jgi:hypothetical protein
MTGEPYKWKARLNVDGGKQVHGVAFVALPIATVSCDGYTLEHLYNNIQRIYPGQCRRLDRLGYTDDG